ncbi:hypothetical protein NFA_34050 [Nocardia farcinica IFM 10152]|uniref:Uncharacterized protein n=1 Tax=Nocardia farcinica (strain IFM 10152) TaxID=247156 RepID=Q5YU89_NOCFA|nr:hypothetical protein NFA_34050 [Nocardia farcinica IFM 10152]
MCRHDASTCTGACRGLRPGIIPAMVGNPATAYTEPSANADGRMELARDGRRSDRLPYFLVLVMHLSPSSDSDEKHVDEDVR